MRPDSAEALRRTLVVAGMPRAGTTYIYHALAAHPGAFVPFRKEIRFFSLNFHRGVGWYEDFFRHAPAAVVRVDISPDYFMEPDAPRRLREFTPPLRVAIGVRDPAPWAVSLHRHLRTLEGGVPPFAEFLTAGRYPGFAFSRPKESEELSFCLRAGFVREQLAAFRSALGDRLLLYDFSLLERSPLHVLRALESFAGAPLFFTSENLPKGRINARGRGSVRWFNYLSSRDVLINLAGRVAPRRLLIALRLMMDRARAASNAETAPTADFEDLTMAREALSADTSYVQRLFAESPLVLGTGPAYGTLPHD